MTSSSFIVAAGGWRLCSTACSLSATAWPFWRGFTGALCVEWAMDNVSIQRSAANLLARAGRLYDAPDSSLRAAATAMPWPGFAAGADWMSLALAIIRYQSPAPHTGHNFELLGFIKYGLSSGVAILWVWICMLLEWPFLGWLAVVIFYVVEAQMVFLFPLALDGSIR